LQDPETEIAKDVWDGAVFGRRGFLTFTEISQPWLRDATKRWAAEYLAGLRSKQASGIVQARVSAVVALSQSLRAGRRHDRGNIITAVGRADIEAFLHRLTLRQSRGDLTEYRRVHTCQWLVKILSRLRTMGLTRAGEMLHGLPDDFAVRPEDVPDHPDPGEPGRDLPAELLRLLCQHLPQLEDIAGRDVRVAVELLIDTGRRPSEIAGLGLDCLARDSDGGPVLVYDNGKAARLQRRLPIGQATAELIIGQQQAVRRRFPATPVGELVLFPSRMTNPNGTRPIVESTISDRHREWVATAPLAPADGTVVDRSKIVPYCYRHTYAQRHADAGVPIDVLRELLDH
jgi:integrase